MTDIRHPFWMVAVALVATATAGVALVVVAAPAYADSCTSPTALAAAPTATNGAVGVLDGSEWWREGADATPRHIALHAVDGNVDLYVYDGSCGTLLCAGTNAAGSVDTCTVGSYGAIVIEVRFVPVGTVTATAYSLGIEHAPGAEPTPPPPCLIEQSVVVPPSEIVQVDMQPIDVRFSVGC